MSVVALILLLAVIVFVLVIVVRTLQFKPKEVNVPKAENIELNQEKIVADMVDMIRCKTVSNRDDALVDWAEFDKFRELLKERFPMVHEKCTLERIGKS